MEKSYWLHRITGGRNGYNFAHDLLENENLISIGWSDFSDDIFAENVIKNGICVIDQKYNERKWELSRNRWNLFRFLHKMQKGDLVLVPSWKSFSVYEIADDIVFSNSSLTIDSKKHNVLLKDKCFYSENGEPIDVGFYRKVKPIALNIPRDQFVQQKLVSRLKIRQTNANINDLESEIKTALQAYNENRPINLREEIIQSSVTNILKQIREKIDANKFEKLVKWYLTSIGAKFVEIPAKNSLPKEKGDADIVAYFEALKLIIMVQVKKHVGVTSPWAIQQIKLYQENAQFDDDYTTLMWVVSSCDDYSDEAKTLAQENSVRLINGPEFARLIVENGVSNLSI